jgi:hypothetical protein
MTTLSHQLGVLAFHPPLSLPCLYKDKVLLQITYLQYAWAWQSETSCVLQLHGLSSHSAGGAQLLSYCLRPSPCAPAVPDFACLM